MAGELFVEETTESSVKVAGEGSGTDAPPSWEAAGEDGAGAAGLPLKKSWGGGKSPSL